MRPSGSRGAKTVEPWSERRALRASGVSPEETMSDVETKHRSAGARRRRSPIRHGAFPPSRRSSRSGPARATRRARGSATAAGRCGAGARTGSSASRMRATSRRSRRSCAIRRAACATRRWWPSRTRPAWPSASDVVPLLLERACDDESLRVRRQAVLLLAWDRPHPDLEAFFAGLLETEGDPRLCFYARVGISRSRARAAACGAGASSC